MATATTNRRKPGNTPGVHWTLGQHVYAELERLGGAEEGWTPARLSRDLNVSESSLSRWLSGENVPGAENARKLARFLSMNIDDLYLVMRRQHAQRISPTKLNARVEELQDEVTALRKEVAALKPMLEKLAAATGTAPVRVRPRS